MKKSLASQLLEELKQTSQILTEAYVFDNEDTDEFDNGEFEGEEVEAEVPSEAIGQEDKTIISRIREVAIDGLKEYSDNPTSKVYEFLKKVFIEADKVLTDNSKDK